MTLAAWRKSFYVYGLICTGVCQNIVAAESDLEHNYQRYVQISRDGLNEGYTPERLEEQRRIRDYFVAQKDAGALFLIAKVRKINEEEREACSNARRLNPSESCTILSLNSKTSVPGGFKEWLCLILADAFPNLTVDTQTECLETIRDSFTPSVDVFYLIWPMMRIGPKAIPYMLELANHPVEYMRCRVSEELNAMRDETAKPESQILMHGSPAKLNCHEDEPTRKTRIDQWNSWWKENGQQFPFPSVPSLFDVPNGDGEEDPPKGP